MEQKNTNSSFDLLRRGNKFARVSAVILAASVVFTNTDKSLGVAVWHGQETEIKTLNAHEHENINKTWIILPGLGVQSGQAMASVLEPTLGNSGEVSYANYSDEGVKLEKLASSIKTTYEQNGKPISFYAHSMGGTVALKLLARLNNEVPISDIVFDCSPYSINDAKDSAATIVSAIAPYYGGGLMSKSFSEVRNNVFIHKNNRLSTLEQLKDAARIAITGSSPRLFTDQLKELGKFNAKNYASFIPATTRIYFISPENPENDQTVNDETAYSNWNNLFGGKVIRVVVKGGGHANPTQRPTEYYKAMEPYFVSPYQEPLRARAPMTQ